MDEEKVTQTAMEPAQQPKPKARGGQRTQGKTAPGTGRGRMAKPHASNSNTAHRKAGTQKQKSEPQNTKSPQEPKTRAEQAEQTEAAAPEQVAAKPKAPRSGQAGGKRRRKKAAPKPEAKPQLPVSLGAVFCFRLKLFPSLFSIRLGEAGRTWV